MEDLPESEQEKTPKKQVQSDRGGSGRCNKTGVGTGGTGDDCDCPRDLPDYLKISTIVWHPNELLSRGICAMIEPVANIIAECSDVEDAISKIQSLKPKLLIFDPDQELLNAADICRRIIGLPGPSILIISNMHYITRFFNQMVRAGVRLFCLYGSGAPVLYGAIRKLERGLPYCDPRIFELIKQKSSSALPNTNLSEREIEVLIRLDMRNQEIAEELNMKSRTVEKHIECVLAKLKVPTRTSAALKAVQLGYTLLPKMPERDPNTTEPIEQKVAEELARSAIEHRKEHHSRQRKKSITALAQEEARRLDHNFVGTEQLLLALIADNEGIASIVLREFGVSLARARMEVETIIGRGSGFVAIEIPFTPRAKRVLELAWDESRQMGHNYIGSEHLLLGLIREGEGMAARVMEKLGVDLTSVRALVMKKLAEKRH